MVQHITNSTRFKLGEIHVFRLRAVNVPEDYPQMAALFNLIELDSASVASLQQEDEHVPVYNVAALQNEESEQKLYEL